MTEINAREIAEQLILDHATVVEHLTIHERLDDYGLSPEDADRAADEIHKLIDEATVTVMIVPAENVPDELRERHGRAVREAWVKWAREQPDPKPSWLLPWEELDDGQREVDSRIGVALFEMGRSEYQRTLFGTPEEIAARKAASGSARRSQVTPMQPSEVPGEFVDDAVDIWHETAGRMLLDDQMRSVLAVAFGKLDVMAEDLDPPELDTCRPVEVDGEVIRVRGEQPMDEESQVHFASVVRAAKRRLESEKAAERAEIRAQTIRDLRDGKVPLEEIAAAQGITGPQNIDDLMGGIDLTDEQAEALEKALTEGREDPAMTEGTAGDLRDLIEDKPHRCPDCYAATAATVRLWPLLGRSRRWVLHYCRTCRIVWGGRLS